jgi:hypothetical protein
MRKLMFLITFLLLLPASIALTVSIDPTNLTHEISPYIYGLAANVPDLNATIIRWGGNPSTRYNWEIGNVWSNARDWEFLNTNYNTTSGSVADRGIKSHNQANAETILSIPAMGYVAKDSFSRNKGVPSDCNNAGTTNINPLDTSYPIFARKPTAYQDPPDLTDNKVYIDEWLNHLKNNFSDKAPKFIAIDNEMDLWGFTHTDVHPKCSTYDSMLAKFLEYATMAKELLPESEVLGPTSCCWWFYWNTKSGPSDKQSHNNIDFLPWFLQEVKKHDEAIGKRTLDYLDIHYYPAEIYLKNPSDAQRIRSTRSLWDPTYRDESWIGSGNPGTKTQPNRNFIQLIPRMKKLIQDNYPNTKLAITEYDWEGENTIAGGITLAEVLGLFGKYDLDIANYWRRPDANTYAYSAFKLVASHLRGSSVPCSTPDHTTLSCFASKNLNNELNIILINKNPSTQYTLDLNLINFTGNLSSVLQITELNKNITEINNFNYVLPPYSITLLIHNPQESCAEIEICNNNIDDNCNNQVDENCLTNEEEIKSKKCTPDWSCSRWSECDEGFQTRSCKPLNSCKLGEPKEKRFCDELSAAQLFNSNKYDYSQQPKKEPIIQPEFYTPDPVIIKNPNDSFSVILLGIEFSLIILTFLAIIRFILR